MVADHRVMSNVRISHDESVASHFRQPSTFDRSPIDRDILADLVVLANLQPRGLAFVGHILRCHPNRTEGEKNVVRADLRWPLDGNVRNQPAVPTQFDVRSDHAVWANLARRRDLRLRIDDGRGMSAQRMSVEGCITEWQAAVSLHRPRNNFIPQRRHYRPPRPNLDRANYQSVGTIPSPQPRACCQRKPCPASWPQSFPGPLASLSLPLPAATGLRGLPDSEIWRVR